MKLIKKAELFITELFNNVLELNYHYHNINHTKSVVASIDEIIKVEKVSDYERELLIISAWFHDTGYIKGTQLHEIESCKIAEDFLKSNDVDEKFITEVKDLIMATVFQHVPKNNLERILCDADYNHIGKPNYKEISNNLRSEWEDVGINKTTDLQWSKDNLNFLETKHVFHTNFAKENWTKMKEKNSKDLEKEIEKSEMKDSTDSTKKDKKKKKNKRGRGVETLFRVTISNHTRLSDIADSKANILLSVNAVIISVALSVLIPKLDSPGNGYLSTPTFVLLGFSVVSIIFAILATRPTVTTGEFNEEDVKKKKVNLLFFGNFYKIPYEMYQDEINEMMLNDEYLYNSLTKDLHFLGIVLQRKYKLLRITYNIFMFGIIFSVLTFLYAYNYFQ